MTILNAALLGAPSAATDPLARERWHHRVLLLFADSAQDQYLAQQREWLDAVADGLSRRDVRVIEVIGQDAPPGLDAAALRAGFSAERGFVVILVGKDGGAKLHRRVPLTAAGLFETIDSMPMAREEAARDQAAGRPAP